MPKIVYVVHGQEFSFDRAPTGFQIAEKLGLKKTALAFKTPQGTFDLARIVEGTVVDILTPSDEEGLAILRHSTAHVLAQAIKELYPEAQIAIGPVIENGFYYDIAHKTPFMLADFGTIEAKMREIIKRALPFQRSVLDRSGAIAFFQKVGETFKVRLIEDLPQDAEITIYTQGTFTDLCRGPHVPNTRTIPVHFKLMKLAGAYWRGDATGPMLQRIYATAWATQEDLETYLTRLEEAERRDHRRLGKEMTLFHFQEEAAGAVFWHPKGWRLYRILQDFMRKRLEKNGYVEVCTPQLVDRSLWEASGHWEKFQENMFITETENKVLAVKPMNCPCHVQIFKNTLRSYKELPLRMAEFGSCHRNEPSGSLHGLMRIRAFTQDDAHIFCMPQQITSETKAFCALLENVYTALGFCNFSVKFSDRPAKRAGTDVLWDAAENALKQAATEAGLTFTLNPGEGAFYGPKLEFVLKDALNRDWQCGTLQVDFVMPERLGAEYVGTDGVRHHPVMLHRAILGSFERFVGILLEHYGGKLPLWLAPVQGVLATITEDAAAYAKEVSIYCEQAGLRVEMDLRSEKITYKIRQHSLAKVPIIIVLGKKEAEERKVTLRFLGKEEQQTCALEDAVMLLQECAKVP
ncbi:MAG: threonine--tRNA ligase [Holosporales bacterium]|jgi:threonyl-tRNA synthetase|nr:threonine--tRNA ligase [Holosporales bacterium]